MTFEKHVERAEGLLKRSTNNDLVDYGPKDRQLDVDRAQVHATLAHAIATHQSLRTPPTLDEVMKAGKVLANASVDEVMQAGKLARASEDAPERLGHPFECKWLIREVDGETACGAQPSWLAKIEHADGAETFRYLCDAHVKAYFTVVVLDSDVKVVTARRVKVV